MTPGFSFFAQGFSPAAPVGGATSGAINGATDGGGIMEGVLLKRGPGRRFACPSSGADLLGGRGLIEAVKMGRYLGQYSSGYSGRGGMGGGILRGLLVGFLPLLFLLASCSGGGGGGGGQGALSVELAFIPGEGRVTVELVRKGSLVQLLNISRYQLTAIDSANETIRIEGDRLAERTFNGSTLSGLTNDHNYTFALRAFYFPVGSDELSNLSLRIGYAEEANMQNMRAAGGGITIGSNRDGDYLADSVDLDDDNDGVDDLDATSGKALDDCPRGDIGWQSNNMTDHDGDGCRDETEDSDDDNDEADDLMDDCPRGELGWRSNGMTDNDGDGCRDETEDDDDDNDMVADMEDSGDYNGRQCRLFVDCDRDGLMDNEDLGEFNGEFCRVQPDCDRDGTLDSAEFGEYKGVPCRARPEDCDGDGVADGLDVDIDGDGLIEIGTAAELDAVRWVLDGSGRRLSEGGALDQIGCGNGTAGGDNITECSGYELRQDISLADYAGGDGWAPLGRDANSSANGCQGTAFSGVFDGNGFMVKELNISRGGEDCIGLFGHLAAGTVIRNLAVRAEAVIGGVLVGGLVGSGDSAEIVSSHLVADEVRGSGVGGLVGSGDSVEIVSSSSVTGEVRGSGSVGGLVGQGVSAEIVSSYSVAGEVSSSGNVVGGLVGWGASAEIVSSSSVAGEVRGGDLYVGGLVGWGASAEIVSSSSVAGEVRGGGSVGGLVGQGGSAEIVSSSSVAGEVRGSSSVGGLVGQGGSVDSSYWHTAVPVANNNLGEEKTLAELRTPTNDNAYDTGIYASWANGADIRGGAEVEDITRYCDADLSGAIEAAEMRDGSLAGKNDNRIWDFGGSNDYPAIRCLPLSLMEQRSWWFINTTTSRPQINRDHLDALISP